MQAETEMDGYTKSPMPMSMPISPPNSAFAGPAGTAQKPPCLNCRLIQMGSAISYGDNRCPQCGEVCL